MLAKKYRVTKEGIEKATKLGKGPSLDFFYAKIIPNDFKNSRFAIIVNKKTKKTSVGRHLLKRRLWSVLDNISKDKFKKQTDFVFLIKKVFKKEDLNKIKRQIEGVVLE